MIHPEHLNLATTQLAQASSTLSRGLWNGGTPFIDPMNLHDRWWLTLLPLAFFLSLAYKGVRAPVIDGFPFWRSVVILALQIIVGMIALAAALHVFLTVLPVIA